MLMSLRYFCNIVEMFYRNSSHSCDKTEIKYETCFILVVCPALVIVIFMSVTESLTSRVVSLEISPGRYKMTIFVVLKIISETLGAIILLINNSTIQKHSFHD